MQLKRQQCFNDPIMNQNSERVRTISWHLVCQYMRPSRNRSQNQPSFEVNKRCLNAVCCSYSDTSTSQLQSAITSRINRRSKNELILTVFDFVQYFQLSHFFTLRRCEQYQWRLQPWQCCCQYSHKATLPLVLTVASYLIHYTMFFLRYSREKKGQLSPMLIYMLCQTALVQHYGSHTKYNAGRVIQILSSSII